MLAIAAFVLIQIQQPDFIVPIEPAPILAIRADLDGKPSILGIDTGSFDVILQPRSATEKTTQVTLSFLSPSPIDAKYQSFPSPAAGIIGLNSLRNKAIGIDAQNGAMSFWNTGNLSSDTVNFFFSHSPSGSATWTSTTGVSYSTVDLEDAGDGHFLVNAKINGMPMKFGLDTDAGVSAIDGSVATGSGFLNLQQSNFGGLNQRWPVQIGVVDSVMFGTQDLRALPIIEAPSGSLRPAQGLFGFDLLANRRAIIDFPAHKLYLADPSSNPRGNESLLPYGIRLAPFVAGKQFIGVVPDSIAAKAGLHSGDELITVDDQAVAASNAAKTGSSLAVDYSKSGLPKTIKIAAKAGVGDPAIFTLSLPTGNYLRG